MRKNVPQGNVNNPQSGMGTGRKNVPQVSALNPLPLTGSMRKNAPTVQGSNPENASVEMRKNVPRVLTEDPPEEAVVMNKSDVPAASVSVQHIGGWKGMNKRATFDSGALSEAVNVSFKNFPCVESSTLPEVVSRFLMVEKLVDTDGTITSVTKSLGKIYDAVTRGDEIFIAGEEGYVYGKMVDGKLCYVTMCEDITDISSYGSTAKLLPTEKTRCVFIEDYDTDAAIVTIDENVCVFSTWDIEYGDKNKKWLPIFPSGSIDFMHEKFLPFVWNEEADTSRIYCVCDENGKADEVWRYIPEVERYRDGATCACWVELRRNLYVNIYNEELYMGYYPDDYSDIVTAAEWEKGQNNHHVGIPVARITETEMFRRYPTTESYATYDDVMEYLATFSVERFIADIGVSQTRDNICGLVHFFEGKGVVTPGDDTSYCKKPGIFNYEETVAPEFEHVTFYKGRVFGSTGSTVICSEYNDYNGWELDTTTDISSEHAWMSTTTANANADGSIVAIREYMGRISVLKSGFMQEVYGGSNPFTIQDVYAVGTPFSKGICEAYGRLCFAGRNAIRTYGGSFPRVIGDELGVDVYEDVQMLGNDRSLTLKTGDAVYKYDFLIGAWEERKSVLFDDAATFVMLSGEMYAVTNSGELVRIDGDNYGTWSFATDAMTENTLSLKRLQKVRLTYELGADSEFKMFVMKSDGHEIETITRQNETGKAVLQRCEVSLTNAVDWFLKLRFTGSGYFKLISMDVEVKNASVTAYE